ncbi:hypothetical protein V5H80_01780 [Helicobacter pylori]
MENSTLYIVIAGLWLAVGFGIFLKKLDMPVIIGYIRALEKNTIKKANALKVFFIELPFIK